MRRLLYSETARSDIRELQRYLTLESGSLKTAQRFIGQLKKRCEKLATLPGTLGRARPELQPDLRSIAHKSYVIFFRYSGDRIEIVSILNGLRDIDAFFDD